MDGAVKTILAVGTVIVSVVYYFLHEVDLRGLCEYDAKPVIFGDRQCPNLFGGKIALTDGGIWNSILSYMSPKIVLRGEWDDKRVVLKKLATANEAEFADLLFASTFKNVEISEMAAPLVKIEILKNIINHEPTSEFYNGVQKLIFCPKLNKIDQLLVHVPGFDFHNVLSYMEVWTSVLLNAEPLMLQLAGNLHRSSTYFTGLPAEWWEMFCSPDTPQGPWGYDTILQPPDWPVPSYHGSCGRLTVVEDCGQILTSYSEHPWKIRARLSVQLLEAAFNFTFNHPELAFYFTDTSPDNIAVNSAGNIRFIDLEHVIIVEKNPPLKEQPPDWYMNHSSSYFPCKDCYTFSPEEICEHRASDYNILAVCREILHNTSLLFPKGFLHGIPSHLVTAQHLLPSLLTQCVENNVYGDRFSIAKDIMKLLRESVS